MHAWPEHFDIEIDCVAALKEQDTNMFSVIFEVRPNKENWDDYFDNAKMLRPELEHVEGFVDNIGYRSLTREGWILSLSNWRDEKSLVRWRIRRRHHEVQQKEAANRGGLLGTLMLGIPRRYSHFVFGTIQAGLTSLIAAGIASYAFIGQGKFLLHWFLSWLVSWAVMLPFVLFAAPAIHKLSILLTKEDATPKM